MTGPATRPKWHLKVQLFKVKLKTCNMYRITYLHLFLSLWIKFVEKCYEEVWGRFLLTSNWHPIDISIQSMNDDPQRASQVSWFLSATSLCLDETERWLGCWKPRIEIDQIRCFLDVYFSTYTCFFSHTKQQCCKNGGLSRSVSRIWNGKNLTFWKFSSKIPLKLRNQGLETCGNPGHGNGPGTLGAYWPITDRGWVADHWSPPRCHGFTPWVRRIG